VPLSVTVTAKLDDEFDMGIPEIIPELDSESPRGNWPEPIDQVYDAVPPTACKVCA
jgi:hypothetical protein